MCLLMVALMNRYSHPILLSEEAATNELSKSPDKQTSIGSLRKKRQITFYLQCKVIRTISAGAPTRLLILEVPMPLVTITGIPCLLVAKPVRKRFP